VITALENRLDYFVENGCVCTDHGIAIPPAVFLSPSEVEAVFQKRLHNKELSPLEAEAYSTAVLVKLAAYYAKKNLVMQLHFNSIRDVNPFTKKSIGINTGFDAVHDNNISQKLASFLGAVQIAGGVPKTIVYSLNAKDYYPLFTVAGAFQGAGVFGKIQLGSAWWFFDHRDGMEEQLRVLGNIGMLGAFVGMLTDSRSFLSYPRHEYFRRILCNLLGKWAEAGEFPASTEDEKNSLLKIAKNISFGNAKNYFVH
jgi:glucuronate isomerase